MRQTVSFVLVSALLTHFGLSAFGAERVTSQITGIQVGTSVELQTTDPMFLGRNFCNLRLEFLQYVSKARNLLAPRGSLATQKVARSPTNVSV